MVLGPTTRRILPYVNFAVASVALGFQYFVLYPWHKELDKDFHDLKIDQTQTLENYHNKKLQRLESIEKHFDRLEMYHAQVLEAQSEQNGHNVTETLTDH